MTLHHGDCLDVMAGMEPESVDAIVTDPPYDLLSASRNGSPRRNLGKPGNPFARHDRGGAAGGFMGQAWDGTGIAFRSEAWAAVLRVAKPSAYLLAFGGTRTVHRMTVALEDAGWIIRDLLVWAYASGFPKSKASLKPAWEPIVMARKPGPLRMLAIDECRIPTEGHLRWAEPRDMGYHGGRDAGSVAAETNILGRWPANVILTDPIFDGGIEGVVGGGEAASGGNINGRPVTGYSKGWADERWFDGYQDSGTYSRFFQLPQRYNEPCPNCGRVSIAEPSSGPSSGPGASAQSHAQTGAFGDSDTTTDSRTTSGTGPPSLSVASASTSRTRRSPGSRRGGRSLSSDPANNVARAATSSDTTTTTISRWSCDSCVDAAMRSFTDEAGFAEQSDSPRWFLIPKADRADREPVLGGLSERVVSVWGGDEDDLTPGKKSTIARRNHHPTVKPIDLMRHLVRLVTPSGGIVLDPFLGSGTTAIAAEIEGFDWIGIEKEREYCDIAEARLNGTQRGLGLGA